MEGIFKLEYGVAGVCVLLTFKILVEVGQFLWNLRAKKDTLTDSTMEKLIVAMDANTAAAQHMELRLKKLELSYTELPKFKTDVRRFYTAIKLLSGDQWPEIRKEIMEDEIIHE